MKYIALDLVLLPSLKVQKEIVNLNQTLVDSTLKLNETTTVPHLSIAMCRVAVDDYPFVLSRIKDYLEAMSLFELELLKIESVYQHNKSTIGWSFELTNPLKGLHYSLIKLIEKYHFDGASEKDNSDFYFVNDAMPYSGITYLNSFFSTYAKNNFNPHITIGQGDAKVCAKQLGEKIEFTDIALYHMGTGCTCEKLLWKKSLTEI
ncbi:2'-5' RNA ligase family protein [Flammeovirga kamogawensis]|uniref:2'-5' RNA ligase family protein n=1 Tax=Flammeovirga kamogawensis TaxID=373891 RepID=A0ABX8GR77_9BACT|nr:2'-5' RNA ligase family protein [Flammeovirga kamogawensis]MBB6462689.1 hypothetical protein [Flammeovirga kamogawensis]QWG06075.1 2'-5' RNA ligase family protein [Flammeovirga kamogawensis]TRX67908.1 hypothetical protein EO216_06985 [Flammeovirga kamogawensis]